MILQPRDCLKQFGDPRKGENEYMIVWNVPENYTAFITNLPKKLYINAMIKFPLQQAFDALIREGIGNQLKTWDGCFNVRVMTGYNKVNILTAKAEDVHWSLHSWGFIGMSLQMLADVSKRKDKTTELSWKLWCKENIKRLGFQLLLIPVAVVLFTTLFNKELNIMNACSIGFSIDFIWDLLNKKASFNKK